jgi:hypothetical protein
VKSRTAGPHFHALSTQIILSFCLETSALQTSVPVGLIPNNHKSIDHAFLDKVRSIVLMTPTGLVPLTLPVAE